MACQAERHCRVLSGGDVIRLQFKGISLARGLRISCLQWAVSWATARRVRPVVSGQIGDVGKVHWKDLLMDIGQKKRRRFKSPWFERKEVRDGLMRREDRGNPVPGAHSIPGKAAS